MGPSPKHSIEKMSQTVEMFNSLLPYQDNDSSLKLHASGNKDVSVYDEKPVAKTHRLLPKMEELKVPNLNAT